MPQPHFSKCLQHIRFKCNEAGSLSLTLQFVLFHMLKAILSILAVEVCMGWATRGLGQAQK